MRSISLGIEASQDVLGLEGCPASVGFARGLGEAGERTVWAGEEEEEEE